MHPGMALHSGFIDQKLYDTLNQSPCKEVRNASYLRRFSEPGRDHCPVAWRTFDILTSGLSPNLPPGGEELGFLDGFDTGSFIGSMNSFITSLENYLNRPDVRKAIHMEEQPRWSLSARHLAYDTQYTACGDLSNDNEVLQYNRSVLPIYRQLVRSGRTVVMYSGDEDPSVHWRGSEKAARAVGLPELYGHGFRPWFYPERAATLELLAVKSPEWGPQLSASPRRGDQPVLGGYVLDFGAHEVNGSFTFVTFRDAGHMVPQFRPQAALHFFWRTMSSASMRTGTGPRLSPPLPRQRMEDESDTVFYSKTAAQWVAEAQAMALDPAFSLVETPPLQPRSWLIFAFALLALVASQGVLAMRSRRINQSQDLAEQFLLSQ